MVCFPIFYTLCAIQCRGQTETDGAGVLTQVQFGVSLHSNSFFFFFLNTHA